MAGRDACATGARHLCSRAPTGQSSDTTDHHSSGRFGRIVCRTCQELMPPTATPNVPQIKPARLKIVDPVASKYQFRLGDGEVDLKALSLDGSDGVGRVLGSSVGKFQERFGHW
jgi:hypothetical protein